MPVSTPPGGGGALTGSRAQLIQQYAALLDQEYPGKLSGSTVTLAQQYVSYMTSHPTADPAQVYYATITGLQELGAVPSTIAQAISAGAQKTAGVAAAIPSGLQAIAPTNLLPSWSLVGSGWAAWFMRGLKVVFGGVLILIGVSHLTGLSNKLTQAAGKVAPIAAVAA